MRYITLLLFFVGPLLAHSQSTDLPLNTWGYSAIDEWDIKSETSLFTTIKPVSRRMIADQSQTITWINTPADKFDLQYLQLESREYLDSIAENPNPLWNHFFQYNNDFFAHREEDFDLHVNPVVVFGGGKDSRSDQIIFENYRGLELRGTIDNKVSFYSLLTENQARYPYYVRQVTDSTLGVPYEGFWKQYEETGIDFLRAQAYIDFNISKHIAAQFGYGKHFIGDGKRSLILSDIGNNYPYLRINTQIWKLQYSILYGQLIGETMGGSYGLKGTGAFTRKYLASHHLSMKLAQNFTLGLFETVIYGDSTSRNLRVEYLNPIIFYRSLEQQDGSTDNVILGMDFKWNLWNRISLYGQMVIDELIVSEAFSNDGWWGNKHGFQLGAKYYDILGIENLNGQVEMNRVRPYTYSHEDNYRSYSHYQQALAHPLGANFREVMFSLNYRPMARLKVQGDLLLAQYGNDRDSLSYGRDILKSYLPENRPGTDHGHELLQGNKTSLFMTRFKASYHLYHNMLIDLSVILRKEQSELNDPEYNSSIISLTYRWNFPSRDYLF